LIGPASVWLSATIPLLNLVHREIAKAYSQLGREGTNVIMKGSKKKYERERERERKRER
jgi:hypothetical protein